MKIGYSLILWPLFVLMCSPGTMTIKSPMLKDVDRSNLGKTVEIEGDAVNRKGGAVLHTENAEIWIINLHSWPEGFYKGEGKSKRVRATGILDEDHGLPLFISKDNELEKQGIPVPESTNLEKASRRYILKDAQWKVVR